MIKEARVSSDVAKLLKDKGFDVKTFTFYDGHKFNQANTTHNWNASTWGTISAPTHQLAMAWLREKGFEISLSVGFPFINGKQVFKYFWTVVKICDNHLEYPMDSYDTAEFNEMMADSHEDAVEQYLNYVLTNLI